MRIPDPESGFVSGPGFFGIEIFGTGSGSGFVNPAVSGSGPGSRACLLRTPILKLLRIICQMSQILLKLLAPMKIRILKNFIHPRERG